MTKFSIFLMMFFAYSVSAQNQPVIYEEYPAGQDFYHGGSKQLYKEIHEVLKDSVFSQCLNKEARYTGSVLVREDSKVSLVKDFDTAYITANKCAYDLSRKVLPHLKNWKPATIDGKAISAIAQVTFVPNDLFENYRDGYNYTEKGGLPEFPGGIHAFRQEFAKNFNTNVLRAGMGSVSIELTFVVGLNGQIENVNAEGNNDRIAAEAMRAVYKIKTLWKPATLNGLPVRFHFRLPIKMEA